VRAGNHYTSFAETLTRRALQGSKAIRKQAQHQQTQELPQCGQVQALLMDADWISLLRHSSIALSVQLPEQRHRRADRLHSNIRESSCRCSGCTSLDNCGRLSSCCVSIGLKVDACREGGLQAAATQRRSRCVAGCAHIGTPQMLMPT
jgi:hypothetical protein